MSDDQFDDDLERLIKSARHLMEMCRIEDNLDKIDKTINIVSWTDSQAILDHIKSLKGDNDV